LSIEALRWAMKIGIEADLEPTQRHILLFLGNVCDEAGYGYPSIAYVCKNTGLSRRTVQNQVASLEHAGLITRTPRTNSGGDRTSDGWQLAMTQPGLPLQGGGAKSAPPRAAGDGEGAQRLHPGGATAAPKPQEEPQEEKTTRGGAKAPTPVARAFKAYADGIKRKYGTDYPPSKRANGILANVVSRVGAERVEDVVNAYLASQNPWYPKVRHKLEFLVRDCEQVLMDLQAAAAGAPAAAPTTARVALLAEDGRVIRELDKQPAGDMLAIAKKAITEYGGMAARTNARYVGVRQGAERRQYSVEELRGGPR
jgi:hypothetical protein